MSRSICIALAALLAFAAPRPAHAELEHDGAGWTMLFTQGDFGGVSPKLSRLVGFLDLQARFSGAASGYGESIVRPAIGWVFTDSLSAYLGYGWIHNSPSGAPDTDEHRIFQQLTWAPTFRSIAWQSRTRLEQRFLSTGDDVGWRFRQFVKATWPIPGTKRLALAVYDEVFIACNDTDWGAAAGFDQNRLFVGPQLRIDTEPAVVLELGYLNRFKREENANNVMDHIALLNVFLNF
jgi:hypothetical protein